MVEVSTPLSAILVMDGTWHRRLLSYGTTKRCPVALTYRGKLEILNLMQMSSDSVQSLYHTWMGKIMEDEFINYSISNVRLKCTLVPHSFPMFAKTLFMLHVKHAKWKSQSHRCSGSISHCLSPHVSQCLFYIIPLKFTETCLRGDSVIWALPQLLVVFSWTCVHEHNECSSVLSKNRSNLGIHTEDKSYLYF